MNNNMPNNFNNNPVGDPNAAAGAQLMGGQSQMGPEPNVMQGLDNTQTNMNPIQGVEAPQPNPGIMQGMVNPEPAPVAMPGQDNSGINSFTLQAEGPAPQEPVVPNPAMPEAPAMPAAPEMPAVPEVGMPNATEGMVNTNPIDGSIPNVMANIGMQPEAPVTPAAPEVPVAPEMPAVPEMPAAPMGMEQPMPGAPVMPNPVMGAPMQPDMGMAAPVEPQMMGGVNQDVPPVMAGPAMPEQGMPAAPEMPGAPMGTEQPQMMGSEGDEDDLPQKKFPLSTREIVLVSIAFVGIIAVIIVYWPK